MLVGLVVLLGGSLAAADVVSARSRGAALAERCERHAAASAARAAVLHGEGTEVLVVGDSYAAGLLLSDASDSWPARLPGRVRVAGFSGSGFSRDASPCGDRSFATRLGPALTPATEVVLVEGGLNDTDQPASAIRAGFERLLGVAGDRTVVVVGPPSAPARAAGVPRVDRLLAQLSEEHGVAYVPTSGLDLPYLRDRLHLTGHGHRAFGDAVAEGLRAAALL